MENDTEKKYVNHPMIFPSFYPSFSHQVQLCEHDGSLLPIRDRHHGGCEPIGRFGRSHEVHPKGAPLAEKTRLPQGIQGFI